MTLAEAETKKPIPFDTGKLDKAIHNLEHLAEADRVRGRDREMLSRDLYDLRQFRASRGRW